MNGMNLTEDGAYSLITVGSDFAITQVVDGNCNVHGIIPKLVVKNIQVKIRSIFIQRDHLQSHLWTSFRILKIYFKN